ncbi:hypothetical protein CFOL_v3_10192, partial [Cephalotus follicularis]
KRVIFTRYPTGTPVATQSAGTRYIYIYSAKEKKRQLLKKDDTTTQNQIDSLTSLHTVPYALPIPHSLDLLLFDCLGSLSLALSSLPIQNLLSVGLLTFTIDLFIMDAMLGDPNTTIFGQLWRL